MGSINKEKDNRQLESTRGNSYRSPECDIYETEDAYLMYFDIPGVEKKDLNLKVEKDTLSLTAECTKRAGEGYRCIRDEMIYSGFKRNFHLGNSVNTENIEAEYSNGTLKLVLQKQAHYKESIAHKQSRRRYRLEAWHNHKLNGGFKGEASEASGELFCQKKTSRWSAQYHRVGVGASRHTFGSNNCLYFLGKLEH